MSEPTAWDKAAAVAQIAAAVGTYAAVVTSLWLASRDRRIDVRVSASPRSMLVHGESTREVVAVYATNHGRRTAVVTAVYWRLPWQRTKFVWLPSHGRFPASLEDGQDQRFHSSRDDFLQVAAHDIRAKAGAGFIGRWRIRRLKVGVGTSTGKEFERRVEPALAELILSNT
jgi:hypothetical protein